MDTLRKKRKLRFKLSSIRWFSAQNIFDKKWAFFLLFFLMSDTQPSKALCIYSKVVRGGVRDFSNVWFCTVREKNSTFFYQKKLDFILTKFLSKVIRTIFKNLIFQKYWCFFKKFNTIFFLSRGRTLKPFPWERA